MGSVLLTALAAVGLYLFSGLRVLREYERAVYFFLGRSWGSKGPGLIYLPPLFAKMQKVSLRVMAIDVPPHVDVFKMYSLLEQGMDEGKWSFEEGHCGQ